MAKLAIIFLFALVLIQYASAGTMKRDAPPPEDDAQKTLENALQQMQELIKNTFTKENMDKFNKNLQEFGETLSAKGKELVEEANANINKLKESN